MPPIRSDSAASGGGGSGPPGGTINGEMYIADGDYIKDIEVNDLRNRYTLTKGSTQKMVNTLPGLFLLIQNNQFTSIILCNMAKIKSGLHWKLENSLRADENRPLWPLLTSPTCF